MTQLTLFPSITVEKVEKHHREFTTWRAAADYAKELFDSGLWKDISLNLVGTMHHVRAVKK